MFYCGPMKIEKLNVSNAGIAPRCPECRTVNEKSICPAGVNHVRYRVRSRGFSSLVNDRRAACWRSCATQTFLDSRHNPTASPRMVNTGRHCPNIRWHDLRPRLSRSYFPFLLYPSASIRPSSSSLYSGANPSYLTPCYHIHVLGLINSTVKVV